MGENIVISRNIIDSEASYSNTSILVYCTTSNNIIHQNIILEGIEVSSNGSKGASGFVITNNIIENSIIGVTSSRIEYNTIKGTIRNPFDKISGCDIKNNIFYATEDFAIFKDLNINNSFSYNSYNSKIYFTNPDVNFSDVNFENLCKPEDGSFPTSASSEGKEVGAFGGTDPYVLSGIPNIPLIKFIDVPANANSENGLPVNVIISTQR